MDSRDRSITYALVLLAAVLVLGMITQVLIETWFGRSDEVNPVIAALAGTAIAALYGHGSFLAQAGANAAQRDAYLSVLSSTVPTPNAPIGKPITAESTQSPTGTETTSHD